VTGGERISTICSAVLTQYRGLRLPAGNEQSRRRTDGRNCYINFALAFTNDSERPIKICPVHDTYLCVNHNLLTIKLGTLSLRHKEKESTWRVWEIPVPQMYGVIMSLIPNGLAFQQNILQITGFCFRVTRQMTPRAKPRQRRHFGYNLTSWPWFCKKLLPDSITHIPNFLYIMKDDLT